jgi:hypothetical protein
MAMVANSGQIDPVDRHALFAYAKQVLVEATTEVIESYEHYQGNAGSTRIGPRQAGAKSLRSLLLADTDLYGQIGRTREDLATLLGYTPQSLVDAEAQVIEDIATKVESRFQVTPVEAPPMADGRLARRRPTLTGVWHSQYSYRSTDAPGELTGSHYVVLREVRRGDTIWLLGRSRPHTIGSVLELELRIDSDAFVTGFWTEFTSKRATYHGVLQMRVDAIERSMEGRWLGYNRRFEILVGDWRLTLVDERATEDAASVYDYRL